MKENVIKFIKNNWRWMLLFICLIGFLALAEDVFHQEIMNGDIVGYDIVSKLFKFNVSTPIAKFMTNFGGAIFVISLTTILFFVIKDKKIGISIITNLGIVTILNQIIKFIMQRPRPTEFRIIEETGYSFPSSNMLFKLAEILEVSPAEFFKFENVSGKEINSMVQQLSEEFVNLSEEQQKIMIKIMKVL